MAKRGGLMIFDREQGWSLTASDADYQDAIYGLAFAADGRLATTSRSGLIRLYDLNGARIAEADVGDGVPFGLSFYPDGSALAVGFAGRRDLMVLDGRTLAFIFRPALTDAGVGNPAVVAWSADGRTLFAAGDIRRGGRREIISWRNSGTVSPRSFPAGLNRVTSLRALKDGRLLVASADPRLGTISADGSTDWIRASEQMDARSLVHTLSVRGDGLKVDFAFGGADERRFRFDVAAARLNELSAEDGETSPPRQHGLDIQGWLDNQRPLLRGKPIDLGTNEESRSLAIHPSGDSFVLGTEFNLRAFLADGRHSGAETRLR